MLSYFCKQIKYSAVPYHGRFNQWNLLIQYAFFYTPIFDLPVKLSSALFWRLPLQCSQKVAENPMLFCSICRLLGPCLAKTLLLFLTMVNCNLWPTLMSNCRFVLFLSFVWLPLFSLGIKTNVLCCPSFEQLGGPLSALAHFWICSAFDLRTCMFYVLDQKTTVMLHDHDLVIR